jgi:predicted transcriptional regulator
MERRCKFDIIVTILDTVSCGSNTKTKIVYATNLNFKLADKYLSFLQEHGLVEQHDGCYKITREGQEYLEKARELRIWVSCPVL